VESGISTLCDRVIEIIYLVFVTVVGPQAEVHTDLYLLGKQFVKILTKKRVSDSFEPFRA